MPKPASYEVLEQVATLLQQSVLVANGYYTDAGLHVTTEPPRQWRDDVDMAVPILIERVVPPTDPALSKAPFARVEFAIVPMVPVSTTGTEQERLHELVDDITSAMEAGVRFFGAGPHKPQFLGAEPLPPVEEVPFVGVSIRYAVNVRRTPRRITHPA